MSNHETIADAGDAITMPEASGHGLAGLFPGYFALVMATGIVAVAAAQQSIDWLAEGLFGIALLAYVVLVVLYLVRLVRFPRPFVSDLTSHAKGPAFLTIVAGTNVLGGAAVVIEGWWWLGWTLWVVGAALWVVLMYTILAALVLRDPKPAFAQGINGTWFLFTVATASVAVLGALLAPRLASPEGMLFACACAFMLGIVLYLLVATLVFYRFAFAELRAEQTLPPYWISMGAMAITVLAGSNLLLDRAGSPLLDELAPFVTGMVVLAWATATFWIPLMVIMGVWRHGVRRVPLRYDPQYWAMIFPLGMYSAATFRMNGALSIDFLDAVPEIALVVALAAWALAFVGLLHHLLTGPIARLRDTG